MRPSRPGEAEKRQLAEKARGEPKRSEERLEGSRRIEPPKPGTESPSPTGDPAPIGSMAKPWHTIEMVGSSPG